jgi:glycosyltransferase involved in cell wall biosynthesis
MTALNVLLLAQFYPPMIGGEEQHVHALASGLGARGHRVTVATLRTPGSPERETSDGVDVVRLPGTVSRIGALYSSSRRLAPPIPDPETTLALRRLIRAVAPEVVHAHNWLVASYLPLADRRRPLVLTLHDYGQICAKKTLIWRDDGLCSGPGLSKCLRCAAQHYGTAKGIVTVGAAWGMGAVARRTVDMFVPVSSAVARGNRLAEDGLRHTVIPNFIPDGSTDGGAADETTSQLPDEPFVLFVGAFARRKGVEVLLDAYRMLPPGAPPLVLIGYRSSDEIPALAALPPNVRSFTDWPRSSVAEAWRRSLLGIVPSTWSDPCPTVVLEAMAAGRPVIGSRIGGIVDLVRDGETGLLVEHGSPAALAGAIAELVAAPSRLEQMGAAAREASFAYRASAVIGRIEDVYRTLLAERAQPPAAGAA